MSSVSKTIPVLRFLFDGLPVDVIPILAKGSCGPNSMWLKAQASRAIGNPRVS